MAIMLRSLGIPARVAVGFTQGTVADDQGLPDHQPRRARLGRGAVRPQRLGALRSDTAGRRAGRPAGFQRAGPGCGDVDGKRGADRAERGGPRAAARRRAPGRHHRSGGPGLQRDQRRPDVVSGAVTVVLWVLLGLAILLALAFGPTALRRSAGSDACRSLGPAARRRRRPPGRRSRIWPSTTALRCRPGVGADHRQPAGQACASVRPRPGPAARRGGGRRAGVVRPLADPAKSERDPAGAVSAPSPRMLVADRGPPVDLVGAVRGVQTGLQRHDPPTIFDRWWPRSLRS